MTWKPGQSGNPAGRKTGVATKIMQEFREKLAAASKKHKFDLVETLVTIANDKQDENRMAALKIISDHSIPKLKAVELQSSEPQRIMLIDATKPPPSEDPLG